GARRVLVATDPVLERVGVVGPVRESLAGSGLTVELFLEGEPEPSVRTAETCLALARDFRPDVVVGLGGGSNMDLAKITAAVLTHGGSPLDYVGENKVPGPILPLICVPTTAGTGSEVSAAAVFTDIEQQIKVGVLSNYLRPKVAVVDPLLTQSCPPKVTAESGIDALTHAIEAYTAVDNATFPLPPGETTVYQGRHPLGELIAEKAISLIGQFLRRAVRDGSDLEAREGMALAATLAGMAFSNIGVAVVHALEYPVGGATHCSHGAGNGLLLPYVMRFNLPVRRREFATIARLLGDDVAGLDEQTAAERAITAVELLRRDIGIPTRLRELGVKPEQLRPFAEKASGIRRILRVNPRPATVDDLEGILKEAY
ncbi:MAG: iron-containing alcohol dehydrogenase, partial [Gemmataceae bacterium]|nr:iron-containing alcohol dehydrogenase [Gemmataceae bacterium]MDW8264820.1 iron-containing alcohol dehydrogenase [Gemmataceae bacterium]